VHGTASALRLSSVSAVATTTLTSVSASWARRALSSSAVDWFVTLSTVAASGADAHGRTSTTAGPPDCSDHDDDSAPAAFLTNATSA
jgi:hypothetical protein